MPVTRPEDMAQSFAEAFNSGNVDAVLALYESNAVLVAPPGQLASGIDAIREALQGFLVLKGKLAIESRYCIRAGDTALTSSKWSLRGTGPDGKPIEMGAKSAEVVRRQTDGRWLYILDHPLDRKSTRLNSSHRTISYAVFCLKKKKTYTNYKIIII